jgi:hypothetical protein
MKCPSQKIRLINYLRHSSQESNQQETKAQDKAKKLPEPQQPRKTVVEEAVV